MAETIASILKDKGGEIWSIGPDASVYEALTLMAEKDVGALLVLSEGKLVGIMSERDYARKVILYGKASKDTLVREIMTSSPITVTPQHSIDECMRIITQHRVRHLPVLDRDRLAGIVSIGDLVNAIISAQARTIQDLSAFIAGPYPA